MEAFVPILVAFSDTHMFLCSQLKAYLAPGSFYKGTLCKRMFYGYFVLTRAFLPTLLHVYHETSVIVLSQ